MAARQTMTALARAGRQGRPAASAASAISGVRRGGAEVGAGSKATESCSGPWFHSQTVTGAFGVTSGDCLPPSEARFGSRIMAVLPGSWLKRCRLTGDAPQSLGSRGPPAQTIIRHASGNLRLCK
jgi:hypothetical protein